LKSNPVHYPESLRKYEKMSDELARFTAYAAYEMGLNPEMKVPGTPEEVKELRAAIDKHSEGFIKAGDEHPREHPGGWCPVCYPEKKMSRRERRAKTGAGEATSKDERRVLSCRVKLRKMRRNPTVGNIVLQQRRGTISTVSQASSLINTVFESEDVRALNDVVGFCN
jgi:hypothetical protein